MQRRTGGRGLGAVLFTDIVGSTPIAAEMGNTRWSELVSRHHRLIRREIRRFGGREQDTAGDGFFVAFERPVDAIRCAVAAANAVRELGIEIRAGVSFGQLEMVEGKAGGLIVNTAARVMSVAGPGEVLVPAATKDLLPGAGISFSDHGVHRLKGIEGEVRLFAVKDVDGLEVAEPLDVEEAAERRRGIAPATGRRAGLMAGALAAALAAAVVGIWALGRDGASPPGEEATAPRFVVELDPQTGSMRQRFDVPNPGRPERVRFGTAMAAGQGAVWIEDTTAYTPTVLRVDPRNGEIRPVIVRTGPGTFSLSLATGFDVVWVSTDQLIKINPATYDFRTIMKIPLSAAGGTALAIDRKQLWIGTTRGRLLRIDPSGEVTAERTVAQGIELIAVSSEGVWVVDQFAGTVLRIDPVSLRAVGDPVPFSGSIDAIEVLGEHIWVLDFGTGLLSRISILNGAVTQVTVPAEANSLAAGLGAIWVSHDDGTITKVDPITVRASRLARLEGEARAIAVDTARGSVWVEVRSSRT
jgi:class 3 adenylate cyclase/streptogramin lyase